MNHEELKEAVEKLIEAMKEENGGRAEEYCSLSQMVRQGAWLDLYLALERFRSEIF